MSQPAKATTLKLRLASDSLEVPATPVKKARSTATLDQALVLVLRGEEYPTGGIMLLRHSDAQKAGTLKAWQRVVADNITYSSPEQDEEAFDAVMGLWNGRPQCPAACENSVMEARESDGHFECSTCGADVKPVVVTHDWRGLVVPRDVQVLQIVHIDTFC